MGQRESKPGETDVAKDNHVATSRAGGDDGEYVGRTFSDDSIDAGTTGAEARSADEQ